MAIKVYPDAEWRAEKLGIIFYPIPTKALATRWGLLFKAPYKYRFYNNIQVKIRGLQSQNRNFLIYSCRKPCYLTGSQLSWRDCQFLTGLKYKMVGGIEALRNKIADNYSLSEFSLLCSDIGVDFDDLDGTTLSYKINELIKLLTKKNSLNDLNSKLKRDRPAVNWDSLFSDLQNSHEILAGNKPRGRVVHVAMVFHIDEDEHGTTLNKTTVSYEDRDGIIKGSPEIIDYGFREVMNVLSHTGESLSSRQSALKSAVFEIDNNSLYSVVNRPGTILNVRPPISLTSRE